MGNLGELETLVLLAILQLGDDAYGVSIGDEIHGRTGRVLSRGAIYSVLRRMQRKGQISSALGEATPSRGGRAKRFWTVTDVGMDALRAAISNSDRMRQGLEELLA